MTSFLSKPFSINGVLSTDKTVLENLNELCTAASAWLTYDVSTGKWSVIINRAGSSIASFNDSNIIGNINISDTGVSELYNSVSVEFPHQDLRDETDYVDLSLPTVDRLPNEVENTLNMRIGCINNPIQAQLLGNIELKQSRVGKIIEFRTDFSKMGLKAGDLIDITASMYGFTNKVFRIIKMEEDDTDGLVLSITALEYDADVYDTTGLIRTERTKRTGIILASQNAEIQKSNDIDAGAQLVRLLGANLGVGLLRKLFNRLLDGEGNLNGKIGPNTTSAEEIDKLLGAAKKPDLATIAADLDEICAGESVTITVGHNCSSCLFDIPDFEYPYEITGVFEEDIESISINGVLQETVSLTGTITVSGGSGSIMIDTGPTAGGLGNSQIMGITIGGQNTTVEIFSIPEFSYSTIAATPSITEGQSVVITVNTTSVDDGTVVPYTITGTASGKVTSPPLTGNITINGDTASITIVTSDDGIYTGEQSLTFTISPAGVVANPCGTIDLTATVSVIDNTSPVPPDTNCVYVSVPAVWCGIFDGNTGALKGITVREYVQLPVPQAGEATVFVPSECSVSGGAIVVNKQIEVAASSVNCGGFPVRIITSFNSVPNRGIITGNTITLYGY